MALQLLRRWGVFFLLCYRGVPGEHPSSEKYGLYFHKRFHADSVFSGHFFASRNRIGIRMPKDDFAAYRHCVVSILSMKHPTRHRGGMDVKIKKQGTVT